MNKTTDLSQALKQALRELDDDNKGKKDTKTPDTEIVSGGSAVGTSIKTMGDVLGGKGRMMAIMKAVPRMKLSMPGLPRKRMKGTHKGRSMEMDVIEVVLTTPTGVSADASGNMPAYFNAAQIVASAGWAGLYTEFDLVKLKKVVYKFSPWYGYKTARSLTPLTNTSVPQFRVAIDPDGALSVPSVATMQTYSVGNQKGNYHASATDHFLYEVSYKTYKPVPLRRIGASALTQTTLCEWADCADVQSNSSQIVGGIIMNTIQNGASPAGIPVLGVTIYSTVEFAVLL